MKLIRKAKSFAWGSSVCAPGHVLIILAVFAFSNRTNFAASISYVGSFVDDAGSEVVRWRSAAIAKSFDIDSNNVYGNFGAVIWGDGDSSNNHLTATVQTSGTSFPGIFGWTLVEQSVNPDIGIGIQSFVHSQYTPMDNLGGSAQIVHGVTSVSSGNGAATFRLNGAAGDYTGRTVRLGLMQDYQEPTAVNDVSKLLTVIQTAGAGGGSNSVVRPATRNGTPDIYFFDLTRVVPGDEFTIACYTNAATTGSGGLASIGTFFLDISPFAVTNPPAISANISVTPGNAVMVGGSFTLSIGTSGTAPLTHLWRKSGVVITNSATAASVSFANVTTNQSGNYDVIVTNVAGMITSSIVSITVSSSVLPSDGVTRARYRLGEDDAGAVAGGAGNSVTKDTAGVLDLVKSGSPTYSSSVPLGGSTLSMSLNGSSFYQAAGSGVDLLIGSLDLNNFSLSCDVLFTSFGSSSGAFSFPLSLGWNNGGVSILEQNGFWWIYHMGSGTLGTQGPAIPLNTWVHVELVRKNFGTGLETRMFLNNSLVASLTNSGAFLSPGSFLTVGANQKWTASLGDVEGRMNGRVDNVIIKNLNAVSVGGVTVSPASTVAVGTSVTLSATGVGDAPLNYSWRLNGAVMTNTGTSGSVVFANMQTNQSGNYDVVVSNPFGSVTSSPVALTIVVPGANSTTFGKMLTEMVDRDRLAMFPTNGYVSRMVSSTDPRDPGASLTGRPAGHKNVDWSNFRRWEMNGGRKEWVLIDVAGPGVMTRWWSGGFPERANCRIYLDNSSTPIFTGNSNLPELMTNQFTALFGSALAFEAARGLNTYAPIPFQQRLKITWDGSNPHGAGNPDGTPPSPVDDTTGGHWFNIEYRQYTNGTVLQSYTAADPVQNVVELQTANASLNNNADVTGNVSQRTTNTATLAAGQSLTRSLTGPGAIRRLRVNVTGTDQVAALTTTWIELRFDGYRTARVPIGPFFNNGRSENSVTPLNPTSGFMQTVAANNDLTCFWVMPFKNSSEVRLVNNGSQNVNATLIVDAGSWAWDERSMLYHAEFRQEEALKSEAQDIGNNSEGEAMFNFVNLRGRGVLAGDTLSIRNHTGGWWGEGDEKIYIDEDVYPSFSGTGTEDYYGYAWGNDGIYHRSFVAQPRGSGNQGAGLNGGVTVNSRLRLLDVIPFSQRLRLDMEFWAPRNGAVDFQAVTHWYGLPGAVALRPVADLGLDFRNGSNGQTSQQVGIPDSAGTGNWNYFKCSHRNPATAGAALTSLTFGTVGNASHTAYGGGQAMTGIAGANLPAIGRTWIMSNASANRGIQGAPGYHELDFHPGQGAVGSVGQPPFAVARWTCGTNIATAASIEGALRNLVGTGDSADFAIYHNGVEIYSISPAGTTLPDTAFNLSRTFNAGDTIDFVIGNKGATSAVADEVSIRAIISLPDVQTNNVSGGGISLGANTFSYGTIKNVAITNISAATLVARASSPNGFPLSLVSVSTTTPGASVGLANGTITYTPPLNFVGVDAFQYTVGDSYGNMAVGTVTVAVGGTGVDFNRVFISASGSQAALTFRGIPFQAYVLEMAIDLASADWIRIATNHADSAGFVSVLSLDATNSLMFLRYRRI